MARSARWLVYTEPEVNAQIRERAAELGIPVNEWCHRVFLHALASKGTKIKIVTTEEVEL